MVVFVKNMFIFGNDFVFYWKIEQNDKKNN